MAAKKNLDESNHYWLKLCFNDWHLSKPLMFCSMQARGVCIEAEMIMKQSPKPGYLLHPNGKQVTPADFARLANGEQSQIEDGLAELVERGEFEENKDGLIRCPRVIKQATISKKMSDLAKLKLKNHGSNLDTVNEQNATYARANGSSVPHERPARAKARPKRTTSL